MNETPQNGHVSAAVQETLIQQAAATRRRYRQ